MSTETHTTDGRAPEAGDVVFPEGRYGRRRAPRRRRPMIAGLLTLGVVAAGVGVAFSLQSQYGQGDYTSSLLAFDDSVPGEVAITFEVYKPEGEGAICRVRSRDMAGAEIGAAEVELPADDSTRVEMTFTLPVSGEPNTGEIQRCWKAD
ncbi:DUF4307 domain-containing protein [Glycomyces buryatensis]|uniref:DUF4307 domain-containing protein n=1 Tax=Glycomyces buryatensis TaxID=2570927 RepID=A0A4S8QC94_9ACTN|nr:DUF4307 domain-containing protein [Glycomyces buryatensis]THV41978.1 DUF4307 domain-containing protein [Glycomyces buryatensis]